MKTKITLTKKTAFTYKNVKNQYNFNIATIDPTIPMTIISNIAIQL